MTNETGTPQVTPHSHTEGHMGEEAAEAAVVNGTGGNRDSSQSTTTHTARIRKSYTPVMTRRLSI